MITPIQTMIASPASAGTAHAINAIEPVRHTTVINAAFSVE